MERIGRKNGLAIGLGGIKPMGHFMFDDEKKMIMKAYFVQVMLEKGFLASNHFYAMYAHTFEHVSIYLKAVDEAFSEIRRAMDRGDLEERLHGAPSAAGFGRLT